MIIVVDNTNRCRVSNNCNLLVKLLLANKIEHVIVSEIKDIEKIDKQSVKGVILTGSPKRLTQQIDVNDIAHDIYALMNFDVPVLGLCFGAQILHVLHGGSLKTLPDTVCGKLPIQVDMKESLFALSNHTGTAIGKFSMKIGMRFCYNDQMVKHNKNKCTAIAWMQDPSSQSKAKSIPCGFKYTDHPRIIYGLLCHPEYYKSTHYIILNFLYMCS